MQRCRRAPKRNRQLPRQIRPVAKAGAKRYMSDRPLSCLIAHPRSLPSGLFNYKRILFRDLASTNNSSWDWLRTTPKRCCGGARQPSRVEFPNSWRLSFRRAPHPSRLSPKDTLSFPDKSLKDWAAAWTSVMVWAILVFTLIKHGVYAFQHWSASCGSNRDSPRRDHSASATRRWRCSSQLGPHRRDLDLPLDRTGSRE